jgi:hypothetical protein
MFVTTDIGARCDRHVGEVFPPRCLDCERLNHHDPKPRTGYLPNSECPKHKYYPLPCDRCERDRSDA